MSDSMKNKFFLISFLPAIAYWYLEEYYPVKIAVVGGLALSILEIFIEKIFLKHIHKISWANFFLIFFLGGLSLVGDEGKWFKLQPAITGLAIGIGLIILRLRGKSFFAEMIKEMNPEQNPPEWILQILEFHTGIFFCLYGMWMFYVVFFLSTDQWFFFKTIGFYLCFIVFFAVELFFLRRKIRLIQQLQLKQEVLNRTIQR